MRGVSGGRRGPERHASPPRRRGESAPPARTQAAALRGVPASHPAFLAAAAVAAGTILTSVTYPIFDTDFWQHLTVGKAIWTLHQVPTRQLWSWPTYGAVDETSSYSWLFRALIWPVWLAGGAWGLFAWRWATTLAAFVLLGLAARRIGARGFSTLFVLVLAALTYRQRAQVRPETLAAVLLALSIWILEVRRHGGPDRGTWMVAVLWVWANTHVSYWIGFLLVGLHLAGDLWGRREAAPAVAPAATRRLLLAAGIAALAAFLNPYGWRALWQPFDFALNWRKEPIYANIGELFPPVWRDNLRNALPLLMAGWPLLLIRRAIRRGFDPVEAFTCALFTSLALSSQRFLGVYSLVAAPYAARGLADGLASLRLPPWSAAPPARAALASVASLLIAVPEWRRPELAPGLGLDRRGVPVVACDFMAAHGVRGRGFTAYADGGYLLWRYWPERERLPFMDIHQSGTREIRRLYQDSFTAPAAWAELERRYRIDYALLRRVPIPGETLLDRLDADSAWALVFLDDASALYVRRTGPFAALAAQRAYRLLPAGPARLGPLSRAWERDSAVAAGVVAELERQARESPWSASAWNLIGYVASRRGDPARAREAFARAVAINEPLVPGARGMLARLALRQGRAREALAEIAAERRGSGPSARLDTLEGLAWSALGESGRARAAFHRALARDPGFQEARDSLAALEARGGS